MNLCDPCETASLCKRKGECHFQNATFLLDKQAKFTKYQKLVIINYEGIRKIVDVELTVRDDGDKVDVVDIKLI